MALKPDDEIKTTQVTTFWSQKNDLLAGASQENIVWGGGAHNCKFPNLKP